MIRGNCTPNSLEPSNMAPGDLHPHRRPGPPIAWNRPPSTRRVARTGDPGPPEVTHASRLFGLRFLRLGGGFRLRILLEEEWPGHKPSKGPGRGASRPRLGRGWVSKVRGCPGSEARRSDSPAWGAAQEKNGRLECGMRVDRCSIRQWRPRRSLIGLPSEAIALTFAGICVASGSAHKQVDRHEGQGNSKELPGILAFMKKEDGQHRSEGRIEGGQGNGSGGLGSGQKKVSPDYPKGAKGPSPECQAGP